MNKITELILGLIFLLVPAYALYKFSYLVTSLLTVLAAGVILSFFCIGLLFLLLAISDFKESFTNKDESEPNVLYEEPKKEEELIVEKQKKKRTRRPKIKSEAQTETSIILENEKTETTQDTATKDQGKE